MTSIILSSKLWTSSSERPETLTRVSAVSLPPLAASTVRRWEHSPPGWIDSFLHTTMFCLLA
jgi:hypothetical protein